MRACIGSFLRRKPRSKEAMARGDASQVQGEAQAEYTPTRMWKNNRFVRKKKIGRNKTGIHQVPITRKLYRVGALKNEIAEKFIRRQT